MLYFWVEYISGGNVMNKNLKFTQMMIGISTMALSFGSIQTHVSAEETASYNILQMKPIGTETSKMKLYMLQKRTKL